MLALKYRPHTFQDLVGQDHVVVVLQGVLRRYFNGEGLPAGFLLAGTRGTGKTTAARIIAALLNCPNHQVDRYYEPCAQCDTCKGIANSSCLFVHEIDAASSGLVDNVRDIKTMTTYCHSGSVRVIIFDEAHSLTKAAFEALLKQLEEPVPNTLYILCTTEPDKFPDTILSRLMIFNFKPMIPELIVTRLTEIAVKEGISLKDHRCLHAIAIKSQGAMRDAIMMLEQLSNYKSPLGLDDVLEYYGLVSSEISTKFIEYARSQDINKAKAMIVDNFKRAVDVSYFLDTFMLEITSHLMNKSLTSAQAVDAYKAAVEVKSKIKYMSAFVAASFLFALLLRMFAHDGAKVQAPVSSERLREMFA